MKNIIRKNNCRVCEAPNPRKILDLGSMPPANSFLKKDDINKSEKQFPLCIYFCESCNLLQLLDVVDKEHLFSYYDYMTSASQPLVDHFISYGRELLDRFVKSKDDLVVDIGGNDATLLNSIKDKCRVLNIEPADNIAELSEKLGVATVSDFFSTILVKEIKKKYGKAKVVTANNVVAHIDDLDDLFEGVKILIEDDGVFVFEVHWVGNLVGDGGFDQIYHEHLCYFSLYSLQKMAEKMGLVVFDIHLMPIHGESLRVFVGNKDREINSSVVEVIQKEELLGLYKIDTYLKFAERVKVLKKDLKNLLSELKKQNKTIAGYGAPAKGNTLLNYCEVSSDMIDFIIDSTPFKQGLLAPGSHIPVLHPDEFYKRNPDVVLLLAWNYTDLILVKEKEYRQAGGKFIIPVPKVKIV